MLHAGDDAIDHKIVMMNKNLPTCERFLFVLPLRVELLSMLNSWALATGSDDEFDQSSGSHEPNANR